MFVDVVGINTLLSQLEVFKSIRSVSKLSGFCPKNTTIVMWRGAIKFSAFYSSPLLSRQYTALSIPPFSSL